MSYFLADSSGPLADFASIGGYADFRDWSRTQALPIRRFASRGYSEDLAELAAALRDAPKDDLVREQVTTLERVATVAKDIVIVSDGMSDEEMRAAAKHPETEVHRAADSHIASFAVLVQFAFARGREAVDIKHLREATTVAEAERAMAGVVDEVSKALHTVLPKALAGVLTSGGEAGTKILRSRMRSLEENVRSLDVFRMKFDAKNSKVISWARKHAAELITNVSKTTQKRIHDAIVRSVSGGGLRDTYKEILDAVGDKDRAMRIARHETMLAASEGQRQGWNQAVEKGLLTGDEKRVWITTDVGACPVCVNLDGKTAALDGDYPDEGGEGPPQHVGCRCSEGLEV